MKRFKSILSLTLFLALPALPGTAEDKLATDELMHGKQKTDRSIVVEAVVDAPRKEVFELWSTAEGITGFFAPKARIESRVGGAFELMFDPQNDPEGEREGTKGAKILRHEPPGFFAFEWRGRYYMKEMNAEPLPTWIEIRFEPAESDPTKTRVHFAHYGFGEGSGWDHAYAFFKDAWKGVMMLLQGHVIEKQEPAEMEGLDTATDSGTRRARPSFAGGKDQGR